MLPPRPSLAAGHAAQDKHLDGAFAAMTGAPDAGAEQAEDDLLQELQTTLDKADAVLLKLRGVQTKEKGDAEGGAKIDDDSSTGSPSMQGMP